MQKYKKEYKINLGEFLTQKTMEAILAKYNKNLSKSLKEKMYKIIEYVDEQIESDKTFNNADKYDISDIEYIAEYKYVDRV